MRTARTPSESEIQRQIIQAMPMLFPGSKLWRVNNTGRLPGGRYASRSSVGMSDLVGLDFHGRFIGVEVKRPGGKQSPEQAEFQREVESRGGRYFIACGVEDLIGQIARARLPQTVGRS